MTYTARSFAAISPIYAKQEVRLYGLTWPQPGEQGVRLEAIYNAISQAMGAWLFIPFVVWICFFVFTGEVTVLWCLSVMDGDESCAGDTTCSLLSSLFPITRIYISLWTIFSPSLSPASSPENINSVINQNRQKSHLPLFPAPLKQHHPPNSNHTFGTVSGGPLPVAAEPKGITMYAKALGSWRIRDDEMGVEVSKRPG